MNIVRGLFNAAADPNVHITIVRDTVAAVSPPAPGAPAHATGQPVTVIYTSGGPFAVLGAQAGVLDWLATGTGLHDLRAFREPYVKEEAPSLFVPAHVADRASESLKFPGVR